MKTFLFWSTGGRLYAESILSTKFTVGPCFVQVQGSWQRRSVDLAHRFTDLPVRSGVAVAPDFEAVEGVGFDEGGLFEGFVVVLAAVADVGAVEDDDIGEHESGRSLGLEA